MNDPGASNASGRPPRSPRDQPPFPLVVQDVGDEGRALHPDPAAGGVVAGRQGLELLPPLHGPEEGLEFLLPLLKCFGRLHRPSPRNRVQAQPSSNFWTALTSIVACSS